MLPQIGIEILKELNISTGKLLDPYCGSGSSFASALECGITEMFGFDINPLAILISKAKYTKISIKKITEVKIKLRNQIFEFIKDEDNFKQLSLPKITNINFWFSQEVLQNLNVIKHFLDQIEDEKIKRFFRVPFSETVRECSYTRNNEFKLYKMKSEAILTFNPDVFGVYFKKVNDAIAIYENFYYPKLNNIKIDIQYSKFEPSKNTFDVVLTSPPYGDSRTTVAYGQFSTLSNEWAGIDYARKIDGMLMGGVKSKELFLEGMIAEYITEINQENNKRALEVSAFYEDLGHSIDRIAQSINPGGKSVYVVGNRTVKKIQLPTDQFIAERFEKNCCKHLVTYKRALSSKAMPSKNSPSNEAGNTLNTMLYEYIIISEKVVNKFT
jgi:methylase of polypeptide subunit release factors